MRRDYFDVEYPDPDETGREQPILAVAFEGPAGMLADRLVSTEGALDANEIDVIFRRTEDDDEGVLAVSNRITGEFVLEANVESAVVDDLIRAARAQDDGDPRYRVRITDAEGTVTAYDKETLLVYDSGGNLRRGESLIPGGVEL